MNSSSFVLGLAFPLLVQSGAKHHQRKNVITVCSHFRVTFLCQKWSWAATNKGKNTPLPCVSAGSARTGRVHVARLATQGANSIKLTYS